MRSLDKLVSKNTRIKIFGFVRNNLNMIIELFFYKHINTTKKLSYKVKEYYYSKLSNVKKFNLDYETFFLEFKDKLLSE